MNIQALFAARDGGLVQTRNSTGEYLSPLCSKLDTLIEHLEVYRSDFKGNRVPVYEQTYNQWKQQRCDLPKQRKGFIYNNNQWYEALSPHIKRSGDVLSQNTDWGLQQPNRRPSQTKQVLRLNLSVNADFSTQKSMVRKFQSDYQSQPKLKEITEKLVQLTSRRLKNKVIIPKIPCTSRNFESIRASHQLHFENNLMDDYPETTNEKAKFEKKKTPYLLRQPLSLKLVKRSQTREHNTRFHKSLPCIEIAKPVQRIEVKL